MSWSNRICVPLLAWALVAAGCTTTPAREPPPPTKDYDTQQAMDVAGSMVPEDVVSFYFIVLDGSISDSEEVPELVRLLKRAAVDHDFLGVTGPDPDRNRRVLIRALRLSTNGELRNMVLIYLGPSRDIDALVERARPTGAHVMYVVYPPE